MPHRDIYIRKADIEIWDSMPKRPEWLHQKLQEWRNSQPGALPTEVNVPDDSTQRSEDSTDFPAIIAAIDDAND